MPLTRQSQSLFLERKKKLQNSKYLVYYLLLQSSPADWTDKPIVLRLCAVAAKNVVGRKMDVRTQNMLTVFQYSRSKKLQTQRENTAISKLKSQQYNIAMLWFNYFAWLMQMLAQQSQIIIAL